MRKILRPLMVFAAALSLAMAFAPALAGTAGAVDLFPNSVCKVDATACQPDGRDVITGTNGVIYRATTLISIIAGIAAVIGIIIGGFMFVTAGGDSSRVSTAKKTITYCVVGVIIIALARTIITFVISRV